MDTQRFRAGVTFGHSADLKQEVHLDTQWIQNRSYIRTLSGFRAVVTFGHPSDSEQKLHLDTQRFKQKVHLDTQRIERRSYI